MDNPDNFTSTPASLWDEASQDYDEISYQQKNDNYPANLFRSKILLDYFETAPKGKVLDAGCGTGQMTRELLKRGWDVTSVDYSEGMLEAAEKLTKAAGLSGNFIKCSLQELESLRERYDYIMLNGVLPYVDLKEEPQVFEQLRKVSRPGTVLISAHYNAYFDIFAFDGWAVSQATKQLAQAGLPADKIREAEEKISSLLKNGEKKTENERTMKTENPLLFSEKIAKEHFQQFDLAYYNFFYLPVRFNPDQDQATRRLLEEKWSRSPHALLFARAFVSFAKFGK